MCVCTRVQVWESYYGMAKYVHINLFQCLFIFYSAILSHVPSCIMRSATGGIWGNHAHSWYPAIRGTALLGQVVLKT